MEKFELETLDIDTINNFAEGLPGGFFIYKAFGDEEIIYYNSELLDLFECENHAEFVEATHNTFSGILYETDKIKEIHESIEKQVLSEKELDYVEYKIKTYKGNIKKIKDYGHLVHTKYYDVYFVFVVDATDEWIEEERKKIIQEQFNKTIARTLERTLLEYKEIYYVDIELNCGYKVFPYSGTQFFNYTDAIEKKFINGEILDGDDNVDKFLSIENIRTELMTKDSIEMQYKRFRKNKYQWFLTTIIANKKVDGIPKEVVISIRNIDSLIEENENRKRTLEIIDSLSKDYETVFVANLETGLIYPIRLSNRAKELSSNVDFTVNNIKKALLESSIDEIDLSIFNLDYSMNYFNKESLFFERLYLRFKNSEWIQMKAVALGKLETTKSIIIGFKNIDFEVLEDKKRTEILINALEEAKKANLAKSNFLSSISHDMRTPMNAIIGYSDLAISHIDDNDRVLDYLKKISLASDHLLNLINNVLDLTRIERGGISLNIEKCNIYGLISDISNMVKEQANNMNLNTEVKYKNIVNSDFLCDVLKLKQILINVISNAIKYNKNNGIIKIVIEEIDSTLSNTTYQFSIIDSGIGMSKDYLKIIYDPFTRANSTTNFKIEGTGLGMCITKGLIDCLGGSINIDSELDKGTSVYIRLNFKIQ